MSNQPTNFLAPEGPDPKRMFLVIALTAALFSLFSYFAPKAPVSAKHTSQNQTADAGKGPNANNNNPGTLAAAGEAGPAAQAGSEQPQVANATPDNLPTSTVVLKDAKGLFRAELSNRGAQVTGFELLGYRKPIELVKTPQNATVVAEAKAFVGTQGFFALRGREGVTLSESAPYVVLGTVQGEAKDAAKEVLFERVTAEGIRIKKRFSVSSDKDYVLQTVLELKNEGMGPRSIALDWLMQRARIEHKKSWFAPGPDEFGVVCQVQDKHERVTLHDLEGGKIKAFGGAVAFAGLDERYFLGALAPQDPTYLTNCKATLSNGLAVLTVEQATVVLNPGEIKTYTFDSYMGPKKSELLAAAGHGLEKNIDFGFFGVLSQPMLWLLVQIYNLVSNFGIAIILLTLIIKALTYPLTQKSFVSMQELKKIAPEVKALQDKYGHDKQMLGQKQMELYKQHGINPMAGCLPMLIQMPIWLALYQMLGNSIEIYQQPFFGWISDLTAPDPYFVLPVVMGASMVLQTAFQPTPDDQPQMKVMMWIMPIFLTVVMIGLPAGLSLYILTNNVLTILQQMFIKRRYQS
jgi:YidC/Oxa1 family membrane protein insertase